MCFFEKGSSADTASNYRALIFKTRSFMHLLALCENVYIYILAEHQIVCNNFLYTLYIILCIYSKL